MATQAAPIDFARLMPQVAARLLGEPNKAMSRPNEQRWGNKGSLSIDRGKGTWYDHEAKIGGGTLDLIERVQRCDKGAALAWMEREGFIEAATQPARVPSTFYDYANPDGAVSYQVKRCGKGSVPPFLHYGPDGRGGFHCKKGCMDGVRRLPYRLPELLAADPAAIVFVVEGEKDADNVARLGLVATTNSGGAGKFGADLAEHFAGRRVVIVADNDQAGRDHAADVTAKLSGVAAAVATLELPGLPEKGDVSDWIPRQDHGVDAARLLLELAEAALHQPVDCDLLPFIDAADWQGVDVPPREWQLDGWEPRRSCVLVTGLGASGKSLLYQQRMTCSAAGLPFLGIAVEAGVSVYVTCEDDLAELHRRQAAINSSLGISWADLRGRLLLVSLKGEQNNELCTFDQAGRMQTTARWKSVLATVRHLGATHVVLDNVAHLFAGSEIVRNQVAAFVGLLDRLAVEINGGVILLGHPNKDGAEYSGSTAWENQVRSRIYLSLGEKDSSGVADPDARRLTNSKPNYARRGEAIDFIWHKWSFVLPGDLPPNTLAEQELNVRANAENSRFMECLDKTAAEKRAVSLSPAASNYAPRVFAKMPMGKGMKPEGFEAAMHRLLHLGAIAGDQRVYQRDNRTWATGLGRAQTPAQSPHKPGAQTRTDLHHKPAHAPDPSTYGTYGAGLEAPAPAPESPKPSDQPQRHSGMILAPGETGDEPVEGF